LRGRRLAEISEPGEAAPVCVRPCQGAGAAGSARPASRRPGRRDAGRTGCGNRMPARGVDDYRDPVYSSGDAPSTSRLPGWGPAPTGRAAAVEPPWHAATPGQRPGRPP